MKKSKVIIPALALMAFSVAASITGTVAWFTASRVATVKAGSFAVVNTTTNLSVSLASGVGTTATDSGDDHTITVTDGYKLTDAAFDHTALAHNVVAPDETGLLVGSSTALADVSGSLNNPVGNMVRDVQNTVFTAFTWNMTFTVTFGNSASSDVGLFLDLSGTESYMHEKLFVAQGEAIPANSYSDEACTTAKSGTAGTGGEYVYQAAPDETGKAFRIAFVPTAIAGTGTQTSQAYAKVWAKNESNSYAGFINTGANGFAVNEELEDFDADYGTATTLLSGNATSSSTSAATAGSGKVLMDSSCSEGIPANGAVSAANALSGKANYLGMFKLDAGKTVSITYTCVAWFDGTDFDENGGNIVTGATDFETIVSAMKFGVSNLAA